MTCILQDFRSDRCSGCDGLCNHKIVVEGLTGAGGIVGTANIPERYASITHETNPIRRDKPDLYNFIEKYLESVRSYLQGSGDVPRSLYFVSETPGTGKTTTSVAILNHVIGYDYLMQSREGRHSTENIAYFLDVNELQTLYNEFNRPRVPEHIAEASASEYYRRIEKATKAKVAVLDDVGVRSTTDGFTGDLHSIINHRVANEMITVYTSNIPRSETASLFSERFYDRMREGTIEVPFKGDSFRGL